MEVKGVVVVLKTYQMKAMRTVTTDTTSTKEMTVMVPMRTRRRCMSAVDNASRGAGELANILFVMALCRGPTSMMLCGLG